MKQILVLTSLLVLTLSGCSEKVVYVTKCPKLQTFKSELPKLKPLDINYKVAK